MKPADPKTVRMLVFVAIGAVGFVVIQLLPSSGGGKAGSASGPTVAAEAAPVVAMDAAVVKDSFSSPIIAKTAAATGENNVGAPPGFSTEGGNPSGLGPIAIGGPLPTVGSSSQGKPEPEPGSAPPPPPKVRLLLKGSVKVEEAVAFIAVDDGESRGYRVGEPIGQGLKLLAIEDDRVVVRAYGRSVILVMGQVTEL